MNNNIQYGFSQFSCIVYYHEHDGIVLDTAANPEQVIVIHYAPAGIAETTLSQFMKMGDNARIVSEITSLSSTVIVDRARSQCIFQAGVPVWFWVRFSYRAG